MVLDLWLWTKKIASWVYGEGRRMTLLPPLTQYGFLVWALGLNVSDRQTSGVYRETVGQAGQKSTS